MYNIKKKDSDERLEASLKHSQLPSCRYYWRFLPPLFCHPFSPNFCLILSLTFLSLFLSILSLSVSLIQALFFHPWMPRSREKRVGYRGRSRPRVEGTGGCKTVLIRAGFLEYFIDWASVELEGWVRRLRADGGVWQSEWRALVLVLSILFFFSFVFTFLFLTSVKLSIFLICSVCWGEWWVEEVEMTGGNEKRAGKNTGKR